MAWFAASIGLLFVAVVLVQFGLMCLGQWALAEAAERGAREALLPRATTESVAQAVRRSLKSNCRLAADAQTMTQINGRTQLADTALEIVAGDELSVNVAASAAAASPDWLQCVGLSLEGQWLQATAKRKR
jgi:hypothetical protein